ncbi:MAG: endo-1,4-beta-xylanase, partial [Phycisphaeraceae bacterium JB051]
MVLMLTGSAVLAKQTDKLPSGGQSLLAEQALFNATIDGKSRGQASQSSVDIKDMPFEKALHVEILNKPEYDRDIQLVCETMGDIDIDDTLYFEVWVRTLGSDDHQTQNGVVRLVLEQNFKPWKKIIWMKQEVGKQWTHFQIPVRSRQALPAGKGKVAIRLGGQKQTLELGGLRLLNFKQSVDPKTLPHSDMDYMGMSADAPWRAQAAKRIEQNRKGDLELQIVDLNGQPVDDATVHVQMTRHAFAFGSVYNTRWFDGNNAQTQDAARYRQTFKQLFNIGVDEGAMKWTAWENPKAWKGIRATLDWMNANDIDVRGHCLVWGSFLRMPKDIPLIVDNPEALKRRVIDHIHDAVGATRGQVMAWDVVNEPQSHNDVFKNLDVEVMADWFKAAHQADPNIRLTLNETTTGSMDGGVDTFERHARMLLGKGAPITALGFQSHFSQLGMPIDKVYETLERFGKLGLDLEITEFDFSGVDEAMQAAFTRDYLTICFSHPKVVSFLFWGFWEGSHWQPDRALFRKDWSIKPNGQAYKDLVFGKWWTDVKTKTNDNGAINVRGFLGDYKLTINANGKTMVRKCSLTHKGLTLKIVMP